MWHWLRAFPSHATVFFKKRCKANPRLVLVLGAALLVAGPLSAAGLLYHAAAARDLHPSPTRMSGESLRHLAMLGVFVAVGGVFAMITMRRRLAQAHVTELRHDFLSTISHELKTPLTSVRLLVETLNAGQWSNPERTKQYVEIMHREITRLSHLLDSFLTYTRLERGRTRFDFTETDPAQVAEHAASIMSGKFRASASLSVAIMPDLPIIWADSDTLVTALLNLLDNAHKFTPSNRRITLRVFEDAGRVHFSVTDNGIGMTAAECRRVMRGFYRVDAEGTGGGAGLGISIVKNVVRAHRGEFDVRSEPDKGSCFTIRIPVHNPES